MICPTMPSYRVELRTGSRVQEALAIDSGDLEALRREATRFVGELMRDSHAQLWRDKDWQIDVKDTSGLILFVLHVFVSSSAATQHLPA